MSKSGTLHGKDETDWRWWHESIPEKLRALDFDGYTIIIASNQGRLTEQDGRRVIDKQRSLIIGDSAGRESDFSDSDVHWAMNAGVPFYTPEVYFLGKAPEPLGHKFNPEWHLNGNPEKPNDADMAQFSLESIVVLVGLPGAGKTTFYDRFLRTRGFARRDARSYDCREAFILAVDEAMRHGIAMNKEQRPVYPRLQFLDLIPRFENPVLGEGFHAIHEVQFKWSGTEAELDIWKKFWF
ncbi:unnamed protein product [Clonostachys rhizophaga]|uniref:Uncharacterized protein n=1 Tax=Clonostachys rhizophaga TaxID=160324 RepID=A0A9N9YLR2_9HYPO|nr:unnamed protein product [Clonostachys rhizophaga]